MNWEIFYLLKYPVIPQPRCRLCSIKHGRFLRSLEYFRPIKSKLCKTGFYIKNNAISFFLHLFLRAWSTLCVFQKRVLYYKWQQLIVFQWKYGNLSTYFLSHALTCFFFSLTIKTDECLKMNIAIHQTILKIINLPYHSFLPLHFKNTQLKHTHKQTNIYLVKIEMMLLVALPKTNLKWKNSSMQ